MKNGNLTCGCYIPLALVFLGSVTFALIALAINSAQISGCAIPSSLWVNKDACIEAFRGMRTLYWLGGAAFGAFGGGILGLASILISGRGTKTAKPATEN